MDQAEKRVVLIQRLLDEDRRYGGVDVPADVYEQKRILNQELANFMGRKPSRNLAQVRQNPRQNHSAGDRFFCKEFARSRKAPCHRML